MNICIIGDANLIHISLISLYTSYFEKHGIKYSIIYWDRLGVKESINANEVFIYKEKMDSKKNRYKKALHYLKYKHFIIKTINQNNFDFLILWQVSMGYLLCDFLFSHRKIKYIINIRDYFAEKNLFFYYLLFFLVKKSRLNTISSRGFSSFLPKGNYILVNSINSDLIKPTEMKKDYVKKKPFVIGYAGNCRFFKANSVLIEQLRNDDRYELQYYGTNSKQFSDYAVSRNIKNIVSFPKFERNQTLSIIQSFDITNCVFGDYSIDSKTLVPIRLYSSIAIGVPVIVSDNTYLAELVKKYDIGYIYNEKEKISDELYQYLLSLNSSFYDKCRFFLDTSISENKLFDDCLSKIFKN